MNINTKEYWESRFESGKWESCNGRQQTRAFARSQTKRLHLESDFAGTIVDFGCGLGDAIPIYRECFPSAKLIGVDISASAIMQCKQKYGGQADFMEGTHKDIPAVDTIIASNVLEHLTDDKEIAKHLLSRCHDLFVTVPYEEKIQDITEHVNTYDEYSFRKLNPVRTEVFPTRGWSQYGRSLLFGIYLPNACAFLTGKPLRARAKQIIFHFKRK